MQRFFGKQRNTIRRHCKQSTSTWKPTQAVNAAVSTVLNTPELIDAILSHLPVLDLIISTRVSKTFRRLIYKSPTLLRILFLLADKDPPETVTLVPYNTETSEPSRNAKIYRIATLCPLLHTRARSSLTMNERLKSEEHEFVHMEKSV